MNTPLRLSPINDALRALDGTWQSINGMPSLLTRPQDSQLASRLGLADLSCLHRAGVKGGQAANWLATQGFPIPDRPNTWLPLPSGGLIARLGLTEFLVEDHAQPLAVAPSLPTQVYPVLRQDLALGLVGDRLPELLRQTCSFNFQSVCLSDRPVILTSLIGVAVTVMPGERAGQPYYRLWCDGTFGVYLWQTLGAIATELGGGAIGAAAFLDTPSLHP